MERTKVNSEVSNLKRFKKVGGGSLRIGNHIYKPGQVFEIDPNLIPKAFRDQVIPEGGDMKGWEEKRKEETPTPKNVVKSIYTAKQREGSQWWDILDANGKVVNEKGLKQEVAEDLMAKMMK
jgi:hypothetical protein